MGVNGTPDRVVQEEGGTPGGGTTVDQGMPGTTPWPVILDPIDDVATETTLARFVGPYSTPVIGTYATAAPTLLLSPALPGGRLRIRRIWVKGASTISGAVEFIVMVGATVIAHDECVANQPYADGVVKLGDAAGDLTLELLSAKKVFYNIAVDEI